ncbi:heparinase II/III family protein [Bacillus sp. MRMR6]|uniref:heparinase II/III family protein n=1 Tax=Bacillus sp. MRMR6 TaxID=1928617 RepID=UPI0009530207|nr:heparinase II/III family protein [Bacillus sp. MRMR6]OLS40915.1 hypothetical protein BTR25_06180 [Bacillus sp. MRMR6]
MNSADLSRLLVSESPLFLEIDSKYKWWTNTRTDPEYQVHLDEIRVEAKRLLQEEDQELTYSLFKIFAENGSRVEFEKVYFKKRRRLTTFAIMIFLEPENKRYVTALENTIWSICNEYTWCLPAHLTDGPEASTELNYTLKETSVKRCSIDLFAAETAFSLAEILQLNKNTLDPLICKRIYEEVFTRVLIPFKTTKYKWENETHNWAAVCAGSVGSAAIYLIHDLQELTVILERILPAMSSYLSGFNPDGICLEGYGYWQYGFGYFVYFADLLKKRTAGQLDLFKNEKVHEIALFQQKCFLDENLVVNFSDASPTATIFLGLSHYLSKEYPDFDIPKKHLRAKYTDDHCSRWAPAIRNIIWFDDSLPDKSWRTGTIYSKDSQWFISKYQSTFGNFSFAAKGGHNDEPHNHNDIGHFILQANNEVFLKDLGCGLYNKEYFGEKRYTFLCNGSQGHSVPSINHQFQNEGFLSHARVIQVDVGDEVEIFEIDITRAYEIEPLQTLLRKFSWIKKAQPKLILEDFYTFTDQPISVIERLITPAFAITEEEDEVILEGKQRLRILYDRSQLYLEVKKLSFINHFGEVEENFALDFTVLAPVKEFKVQLAFQFE